MQYYDAPSKAVDSESLAYSIEYKHIPRYMHFQDGEMSCIMDFAHKREARIWMKQPLGGAEQKYIPSESRYVLARKEKK